jgi:hypothetical protein
MAVWFLLVWPVCWAAVAVWTGSWWPLAVGFAPWLLLAGQLVHAVRMDRSERRQR